MNLLSRPDATVPRTFPKVEQLYRASAENLVAPILDAPLGWVQRIAGWRLSAGDRVKRLFYLHRSAVEAEEACNWKAADVYFFEVMAILKGAPAESDLWQALQEKLATSGVKADLSQLRQRVLEEVFIDTHCGFYNGYSQLQGPVKPDSRQFFHLDRIVELVELAGGGNKWIPLPASGFKDRIAACKEAKEWSRAGGYSDELLRRYPQEEAFMVLKANLLFERALATLNKSESEWAAERNASALQNAAADLESLRSQYPDHAVPYELIAHLKHIRAVNLANAGLPSDALLSNEESLAYWPIAKAESDRQVLSEMMQNMIQARDTLLREISQRPNTTLNNKGLRMKMQADAGFGPANRFTESDRAKEIRVKSNTARLRGIWKRMGLTPPSDRLDELTEKLITAFVSVKETTGGAAERIGQAWAEVTRGNDDLKNIPASAVSRFVQGGTEETSSGRSEKGDCPMLPVPSGVAGKGREPIGIWLFSRQDLFLKGQAAVAIALLLATSVITLQHHIDRKAREASWSQVEQAVMSNDDLSTVAACESFFSTSPPDSDQRVTEGKELYRAAMVHWFARTSGDLDAASLKHVERYRQLSAKWKDESNGGSK
jgi:hypothetical protein